MNCRKKVGLRHRSFRSFQARKTAFGAGKFWSVKKNRISIGSGPIKILAIPGLSTSRTARKKASTMTGPEKKQPL
jgi:hypothetical protein